MKGKQLQQRFFGKITTEWWRENSDRVNQEGKGCGTMKNGQYRLYFWETWVRWVSVNECAFFLPQDRIGLRQKALMRVRWDEVHESYLKNYEGQHKCTILKATSQPSWIMSYRGSKFPVWEMMKPAGAGKM